MKLYELIDVIDYNRDSTLERLQICRPDSEWEDFDECLAGSALLIPLYHQTVRCIEAICENVIRVDIDWTGITHNWEREEAGA